MSINFLYLGIKVISNMKNNEAFEMANHATEDVNEITNEAFEMANHATEDVNEITNEAFEMANHATEDVKEITHTTEDSQAGLNVDDFIERIGEFGKAQKVISLLLSLMIIPTASQRTIMVFIGDEPPWTCVSDNRTNLFCNNNGTFSESNSLYQKRCSMSRLFWNFTKPQTYSVVTQVSFLF